MKIISDGTAQGTKVFVDDVEIKNVMAIHIEPLVPGKPVTATIQVMNVELDVEGMEPSPDLVSDYLQHWDDILLAFALPPCPSLPAPSVDLKKRVRDW